MKDDLGIWCRPDFCLQLGSERRQDFGEVFSHCADLPRLGCVLRIAREQVSILLDLHTAAAGIHQDRRESVFLCVFNVRPPCIDVASRVGEATVVIVQVIANCAATAGRRRA